MKTSILKTLALTTAAILSLSFTAFATGGGSGNGTGGGKGEKIEVESCSIKDGATEIAVNGKIELVFSKNVINASVKDKNIKLFSLTDSSGAAAEFTVEMGDDQTNPEVKNNVAIAYKNLKANESYKLTISKDLESKSGENMKEDYVVSFKTLAAETATPPTTENKPETPQTGAELVNTVNSSTQENNISLVVSLAVIAALTVLVKVKAKKEN